MVFSYLDPHFVNSHFQLASATHTQTRRIVYVVDQEPRSIDFEDSLDIDNNAFVLLKGKKDNIIEVIIVI